MIICSCTHTTKEVINKIIEDSEKERINLPKNVFATAVWKKCNKYGQQTCDSRCGKCLMTIQTMV
jgi:hypothetical protein